ncbi:hypothetical protein FRZ06_09960 [Anoxybacterium hadale]|uniref:Uncharacterized protein n=1 Tax=Anoxybacterium hadale TaxID=3408580 RepID=A0ACD1ABI1_9FIRM|nr:hypothetical protein FRZ06_09960 [Clostridiales bacterium]
MTTVIVFTIAILVVIAGFFLLDIEKIALNYWAFGSLLFSLAVSLLATLALVAPKENKGSVFYTGGLSSAIWIYEIMVVISVFFTNKFVEHMYRFVFLEIAINALFFISALVIYNVSARLQYNDAKTYKNLQSGEYNKPKRGGF